MPAQGSKGAQAPSGKSEEKQAERQVEQPRKESSSTPTPSQPKQQGSKLTGGTAQRMDHVPPGVLEDTKVADTKRAGARGADTGMGTGIFSQPNAGNYQAGVKREASVVTDLLTGANTVIFDHLKSSLTGDILETIQEPRAEAEVEEAQARAQRKLASGKPATA